jgi:hypothetical protein
MESGMLAFRSAHADRTIGFLEMEFDGNSFDKADRYDGREIRTVATERERDRDEFTRAL